MQSPKSGVDPREGFKLADGKTIEVEEALGTDHTATGTIINATAGENVAFPNLAYLKSDGKFWKADANVAATTDGLLVIILETINANATGKMLLSGYVRDDSWTWTVGAFLFVSGTAGALTETAPSGAGDQVRNIATAHSATTIFFSPDNISGDLQAARMTANIVAAIAGLDPTFTSLTFDANNAIKHANNVSQVEIHGGTGVSQNGAYIQLSGGGYALPGYMRFYIGNYTEGELPDSKHRIYYLTDGGETLIYEIDKSGNFTTIGSAAPSDNAKDWGDATHRWKLVRGVTITSGDYAYEEQSCPLCGKNFKLGDFIKTIVVKTNPHTHVIPVHENCINPKNNFIKRIINLIRYLGGNEKRNETI